MSERSELVPVERAPARRTAMGSGAQPRDDEPPAARRACRGRGGGNRHGDRPDGARARLRLPGAGRNGPECRHRRHRRDLDRGRADRLAAPAGQSGRPADDLQRVPRRRPRPVLGRVAAAHGRVARPQRVVPDARALVRRLSRWPAEDALRTGLREVRLRRERGPLAAPRPVLGSPRRVALRPLGRP